jgi:POT family proton-dependent oligopeptide transporter
LSWAWCFDLDGYLGLYTGLGCNSGSGVVKPNISTMVGGLYPQGDIRRDKGFSIFYIGINTGSFIATMVIGFVVVKWGWHAGFGLAGIMLYLLFLFGDKNI